MVSEEFVKALLYSKSDDQQWNAFTTLFDSKNLRPRSFRPSEIIPNLFIGATKDVFCSLSTTDSCHRRIPILKFLDTRRNSEPTGTGVATVALSKEAKAAKLRLVFVCCASISTPLVEIITHNNNEEEYSESVIPFSRAAVMSPSHLSSRKHSYRLLPPVFDESVEEICPLPSLGQLADQVITLLSAEHSNRRFSTVVVNLSLVDEEEYDMSDAFTFAVPILRFAWEKLSWPCAVLCQAGRSRSASLAAAFLLDLLISNLQQELHQREAEVVANNCTIANNCDCETIVRRLISSMQTRRMVLSPNPGFLRQLVIFARCLCSSCQPAKSADISSK